MTAPWTIGAIEGACAAGARLPIWVDDRGVRFIEPADLEAAILHWASSGWPDDWHVFLAVELSWPEALSDETLRLLQERYPPRVAAAPVQSDLFEVAS